MASFKITDLTELAGGSVADTDVLEIVDLDADQSKKVTIASLKTVFAGSGVSEGSAYTGGTSNGIMFNDGDTFATSSNLLFSGSTLTLTDGASFTLKMGAAGGGFGYIGGASGNGFSIYSGNAQAIYCSPSQNVGIGATSPSAKLHTTLSTDIVGNRLDLSNGQTEDAFQINSYGNTGGDLFRVESDGAIYGSTTGYVVDNFRTGKLLASYIKNEANNKTVVQINQSNGDFYLYNNVGIGTTSPSYKLHVVGDSWVTGQSAANQLYFNGSSKGAYILNPSNGVLNFLDNSAAAKATIQVGKIESTLSTDVVGMHTTLSNGQTADAFQINSFGNTGGDVFRVEKGGLIHASGTNTQQSTTYTLTNVVTNGTKTITYDSNSNVKVGDVITGTNIATAAHIISVESDTEARMNVIATGSGTNSATIIPMFAGVYSNVTLSKNAGISSYYSAGLFVSPTNSDSGSSIKSAGAYIDNPSSSATTTGMYLSSKSDTILTFNRTSPSTEKHQWYMTIGDGGGTANSRGDFYIGAGEFFPKDNSHSLRIDDFGLAIGGIGYLSSDTANQAFTIWGGISSGGNVLNVRWRAANDINNTSGNVNLIAIDSTLNGQKFKPTSGTGTVNYINLSPEINQTGGASGISRAIYINPLLTSAADFRAIEVTGGNVVLALPTSSAGLPSGALWNDSGTVKIV